MDIFRSVISNLKMEGGSSSETLVLWQLNPLRRETSLPR
jgi:hypothetical protein